MKLQSKLLRVALVRLPVRVAVALSVLLISAAPSLGEQPAGQNPPERGKQVMPLKPSSWIDDHMLLPADRLVLIRGTDASRAGWAEIQKVQVAVAKELDGIWTVETKGLGALKNIHPRRKKEVGCRAAEAACKRSSAPQAAAFQALESPVPFKTFEAGDRVAFLGDSITASGDYVHIIRLFYATRFPDRPVCFYNCGIGGARAETSWPRIDTDCLDLDPTTVVIMLGMNDAGVFSRPLFEKYQDYMTRIMDRVADDPKRKLALIVSSPYDQTAKLTVENKVGKNDTIRKFGEWLVEQGRERKAPVIDFNTLMLQINAECQKADPAFSVIGSDRIHPDVRGHTVMTYSLARAQHIEGPVARVEIDAATGSTKALNATAEELKKAHDELSFIYKPKALPYPAEALPFESPDQEWVTFTEDLNREWIVVRGLKKGHWALSINGESVGEFTADEMAGGIDLAREPKSPSYRHAQEVAALASQVETAERNLRAIARVRWIILEPRRIDLDDVERADAAVREYLARYPKHAYWRSRADIFFRLRSPEKREAERVRMEGLMTRLYEINKPKPQRVELRHIADSIQ